MQRFAGDGDGDSDGAAVPSPEGSCSGALGGMLVVLLVRCLGVVWWQNNVFFLVQNKLCMSKSEFSVWTEYILTTS